MDKKNQSTTAAIFSIIAAVAVLIVFVSVLFFVGRSIFGGQTDQTDHTNSNQASVKDDSPSKSSFEKPIAISPDDTKDLTGSEFSKKYDGEWIAFDGLVYNSIKLEESPEPFVSVMIGDDPNAIIFSDLAGFSIASGTATFDDSLQTLVKEIELSHMTENYPKVHVVARVDDSNYDKNRHLIRLEPNVNADGKTPSVTKRD